MKLVKCSNGHFYDGEKYPECPHCHAEVADVTMPPEGGHGGQQKKALSDNDKTEPIPDWSKKPSPDPVPNPTPIPVDPDYEKTVSIYDDEFESGKPVVGWLVCTEGSLRGRSFELYAGMNFIGRNRSNHICIPMDKSISREKHGIVIFDPRSKDFLVQSGMSAELLYLNDAVVLQPIGLNAYDTLLLGNTKFLFVPFCGQNFSWE